MRTGRRNKRVTFQTETKVPDGAGGYEHTWGGNVIRWGGFVPERGTEKVQAGRIEAPLGGVLNVRYSSAVAAFGSEDRVLIDGQPYNIRSVSNPDQRRKELDFIVEGGVAV